jgi:hypothetical protein
MKVELVCIDDASMVENSSFSVEVWLLFVICLCSTQAQIMCLGLSLIGMDFAILHVYLARSMSL